MRPTEMIELAQLQHRGLGRCCFAGEEGSIWQDAEGCFLSDLASGDRILEILRAQGENPQLFLVCHEQAHDQLKAALSLESEQDLLFVYRKAQPPCPNPALDIRPLPPEVLPLAAAHYRGVSDPLRYLTARAAEGHLWALLQGGALAGFIGLHTDGSMGMLEILPEFRRRGFGGELERFAIAWQLERGFTPFCHVRQDNAPSAALQQKLGLSREPRLAHWLWTRN